MALPQSLDGHASLVKWTTWTRPTLKMIRYKEHVSNNMTTLLASWQAARLASIRDTPNHQDTTRASYHPLENAQGQTATFEPARQQPPFHGNAGQYACSLAVRRPDDMTRTKLLAVDSATHCGNARYDALYQQKAMAFEQME